MKDEVQDCSSVTFTFTLCPLPIFESFCKEYLWGGGGGFKKCQVSATAPGPVLRNTTVSS